LLAALLVAAGYFYAHGLEERYVHAVAGEFSEIKLQGIALQEVAFTQPDLLVLYGSSELVKEMPNNASEFFANYPTGFRVFPVGKPGVTSLALLEKAGAVGESIRGRKVAISLSPGWFFTESFDPKYYEGNFSELQAEEVAFSDLFSHDLKRDIARRMIEFPRTLEGHDLLSFTLQRLARDSPVDRLEYVLAWPLGKIATAVGRGQDHLEVALHLLDEDDKLNQETDKPLRMNTQRMRWAEVLKRAARFANSAALQKKRNEVARKHLIRASRDRTFIQTLAKAHEWTDVELLMRTLKELGAEPLFLSMPVEDIRLEVNGLSPQARTAYLERMQELAYKYGFPLRDFHEFETDPTFLVDFLDHLSGSGWLYYNKALDDFYHGRLNPL
jgi:D-alanine transfer protein